MIMYASTITGSMQRTIDETNRRRKKQQEYNIANNITPIQIETKSKNLLYAAKNYQQEYEINENTIVNDPIVAYMTPKELHEAIKEAKRRMEEAAAQLDFIAAARARDEMNALKKVLEKRK